METLKSANLALAFAVELAMIVALGFVGWALTDGLWLRIVLMLALPAIAVALWAMFAAPRATRRLPPRALLAFKIAIFAVTALLLWTVGHTTIAAAFAVVAAANLALAEAWQQG